jgi:hypothetical protein
VDITILTHDPWIRRHPLKLPSNLDLDIVGIPPQIHAPDRDRTSLGGQHLHWQQTFGRASEWISKMTGWLYEGVSFSLRGFASEHSKSLETRERDSTSSSLAHKRLEILQPQETYIFQRGAAKAVRIVPLEGSLR